MAFVCWSGIWRMTKIGLVMSHAHNPHVYQWRYNRLWCRSASFMHAVPIFILYIILRLLDRHKHAQDMQPQNTTPTPHETGSVHACCTAGCTNVRLCCVETQLSTIDPKHLLLQLWEQPWVFVCVCVLLLHSTYLLNREPTWTFLQMQWGNTRGTFPLKVKESFELFSSWAMFAQFSRLWWLTGLKLFISLKTFRLVLLADTYTQDRKGDRGKHKVCECTKCKTYMFVVWRLDNSAANC